MLGIKIIFLITCLATLADATPHLPSCVFVTNLFDKRGDLIKKVCEIREAHKFDNAENSCIKRGMHLLEIDSNEMLIELSKALEGNGIVKTLGRTWVPTVGYWINGRRNYHGEWYTYTSDEKRLLNADVPFTHSPSHSDSCLALKKDGTLKVSGFTCNHAFWHLCEFQVIKNQSGDIFDNFVRSGN